MAKSLRMTSKCPKCQSPVAREGQRFCYRCGHELPASDDSQKSQPDTPVAESSDNFDSAPTSGPFPAYAANSPTTPQQGGATEVVNAETIEVIVDTAPQNAAAVPDAKLRVLLPTGDLFDRDLGHSDTQLGKGPRNDIVIADPAVSSAHAIIHYENGEYSIRDLGSRNGTFVDGERISEPHVLRHGDVVGLGLSKLTFRLSSHDQTADFGQESPVKGQPAPQPPPLTEQSLAHAVVAAGLVKQDDVDRIRGAEAKDRRLYRALVEEGLAAETALRDLMSRTFQIPSIDLEGLEVDEAAAAALTSQLARDHQILAVGEEDGRLILAVADPTDTAAAEEVKRKLGSKVSVRLATASQIAAQIDRHYAPKLIGVLPSGDKLEYPITHHETNIGKAAHNHIVLTDPTVSNAHAILIFRGGGYSIADLGSRNGTFVNGERLAAHAHVLRHGDTIQLGQTIFTFRNPSETAANVTAVLSPEALDEIKKRATSSAGERPGPESKHAGETTAPPAAAPIGGGKATAGSADDKTSSHAAPEAVSPEEAESDAEKKKKKKKKGKDERMRAAYVSGLSRILAQVIAVMMSVGLALYLTQRSSDSGKPTIETSSKGKAKIKIASPGAGTPFDGGVFEASGVVQVPGTGGVYFVDDSRPGEILWMALDESGRQSGPIKPIEFGASVADPEGITYGGSFFYLVGSQSHTEQGERNALVRFAVDPVKQVVLGKADVMSGLRDFLIANVPELKAVADVKGNDGGVDVEGIAYDATNDRLLLGLRSPLKSGKALIVPIKLRDPRGSFSTENVLPPSPAIEVQLGGLGIRDIEFDLRSNSYFIIAGSPVHGEGPSFSLWEWNGGADQLNADSNPREITKLDAKMKPEGVTHAKIGGKDFVFIVGDGSSYMKLDYSEAP
jgi:pSer/pThr/pTyr-binding forkhead associated (FHA) protein